jgi:RNA polymerase sigma-70 factor (ECF subfamily)
MFAEKKRRARFNDEAMVHLNAMYGLALRLSKNERDAEDLVQETCLKAFQHFDKYTQGTNCKAWLFKILTNTFINRYRKKQRQRTVLADDMTPSPLARVVAATPNPIERNAADQSELFERLFGDEVSAALEKVPVDFRMAVLLVDLYNFSYKETAEMMRCPIGTVMSRLYRGRRILQGQLADYAEQQGIIKRRENEDKVLPFVASSS